MTKFKVGDEVETLVGVDPDSHLGAERFPVGSKGKICAVNRENQRYDVKVGEKAWWYSANELKLIPKYKTLAQLREESDRNTIKVAHKEDLKVGYDFIGIIRKMGVIWTGLEYEEYRLDRPIWQLYQEPEEDIDKSGVCLDKMKMVLGEKAVNDFKKGSKIFIEPEKYNLIRKDLEEKPAEKCEHEKTALDKASIYYCLDCGAELEEKWLWYIKSENGKWVLFNEPKTKEAILRYHKPEEIKQVSNSRELFEVWK